MRKQLLGPAEHAARLYFLDAYETKKGNSPRLDLERLKFSGQHADLIRSLSSESNKAILQVLLIK